MALPGPPPKPTALKLIAGNPGKQKLNENEPKPRIENPGIPKHLTVEARAEWDRLAPALIKLKLLTKLDRAAFAAYCQAWGRWVEAEGEIARLGAMKETQNGYLILNGWTTVSKHAVEQMHKFMGDFGLTPAARSRICAPNPEPEEEDGQEIKKDDGKFAF